MTITWVQGRTAPVTLQFTDGRESVDLTGYTVVAQIHPRFHADQPPLADATVTVTDAAKGLGSFIPPDSIDPGAYTIDFDLTGSDGSLSPGNAQMDVIITAHADAPAN